MGLARLLSVPEQRAADASLFGRNADAMLWASSLTAAGEAVTIDRALQVPAFSACVRRKQDALMAMPIDAYVSDGKRRVEVQGPSWLRRPNPDETWKVFVGRVGRSLELSGNAFILPVRDRAGRAQELHVAPRDSMSVSWLNGRKVFTAGGYEFRGEVVHIQRSPSDQAPWGVSVVTENAELFGLALAVQSYAAEFFGSGAIPPGVIEAKSWSDAASEAMVKTWRKRVSGKGRRWLPGVLIDASWKDITRDAEKSQLSQVQNDIGVQIATLCGVPSQFVGLSVAGSSLTYANVVDQFVDFLRKAMLAPMELIAEALSDDFNMLMPKATRVRFRTEIFEKPDTKGRYDLYKVGIDAGFLTVDEVRALEDLDPLAEANA